MAEKNCPSPDRKPDRGLNVNNAKINITDKAEKDKPCLSDYFSIDEMEHFTEYAAKLEYDAGFSRNSAEVEALKVVKPADYQLCYVIAMKAALEEGKTGEAADGYALDEIASFLARLQGGEPEREKPKTVKQQTCLSGFDAVLLLAEKYGWRFIPCGADGKPAVKWAGENQNNFTGDIGKLKSWHKQSFRRFSYLPGLSGFVGLDIDCGHADGADGIADFYKVIEGLACKNKDRLPSYLKDIPHSFPCYVESPSGGCHLFLKYSGDCKISNLVFEGAKIEIKYMNSMLSLGEKQNGVYILRGSPDNAPEMPRFFAELINPQPKPKPAPTACYSRQTQSLEKLLDKVLRDAAGNNDRQKKFAWRAAYFGYGIDEVLSFVKSRSDVFGSDADTESVVNHAWRANTGRATA